MKIILFDQIIQFTRRKTTNLILFLDNQTDEWKYDWQLGQTSQLIIPKMMFCFVCLCLFAYDIWYLFDVKHFPKKKIESKWSTTIQQWWWWSVYQPDRQPFQTKHFYDQTNQPNPKKRPKIPDPVKWNTLDSKLWYVSCENKNNRYLCCFDQCFFSSSHMTYTEHMPNGWLFHPNIVWKKNSLPICPTFEQHQQNRMRFIIIIIVIICLGL